jgi:hypothetical protein
VQGRLFHQKEKIRQNQGSGKEGQGKGKGEKGHVIHGRGIFRNKGVCEGNGRGCIACVLAAGSGARNFLSDGGEA